MSEAPRQLPLDLPHAPSFAAQDYLPAASNRDAQRAVQAWPRWAANALLLLGPAGSGKSHLAAIWARAAQAHRIDAAALGAARVGALAKARAILVEDADRVGANETALFHLLNIAREAGASVLLTARNAPDLWAIKTPDLLSRLRQAPTAALGAPDDELIRAVLFKLFGDRQLSVEPAVVAYVAKHMERSLGAARAIVAKLDEEAMARGRGVTRAMAAELLRWAPEEG